MDSPASTAGRLSTIRPTLPASSASTALATAILVFKVYQDGFKGLDLGGSAAQSVILMTIVITLTVVQFRWIEKKVQY